MFMPLVLICMVPYSLVSATSIRMKGQTCGKRPLSQNALIYGGNDSSDGEWPWHTAVYVLKSGHKPTYQCGGTLISNSIVLTSAHCTFQFNIPLPADRLVLRFGSTDLKIFGIHVKEYKLAKVLRHGNFNPENLRYDVALLKTLNEVELSDYIQPICLPVGSIVENVKYGHVVGWGIGEGNVMKTVLQKATLGLVDEATCLKSNANLFSMLLSNDNSNFCAGNINETNVCEGDSGGGMFVYNKMNKQWQIRGIINAGARARSAEETLCGTKQFVMFANVTYFIDWITGIVDEKSNLLDLDNCAEDDHDQSILEQEKPIFSQYPWITVLEYSTLNSTEFQTVCSGVLIHPQFVLTMGHCVCDSYDGIELKSVRLGDYDLFTNPDTLIGEDAISTHSISVEKVVLHPNFKLSAYGHNIALIKLTQPTPRGMFNIRPICLPNASNSRSNYLIVGWKRAGANVLMREIPRIQKTNLCTKVYSSLNVHLDPEDSFICIESFAGAIDDCFSYKSGSSLHYLDNVDGTNIYYLKGIYGFGESRCKIGSSAVFVDVHYYLKWIKKTVEMELHW